jgi:hypothetical protein
MLIVPAHLSPQMMEFSADSTLHNETVKTLMKYKKKESTEKFIALFRKEFKLATPNKLPLAYKWSSFSE